MKNLIFIFISLVIVSASCKKVDKVNDVQNVQNFSDSKAAPLIFLTDCLAQTWDGNIDHDCSGDPSNCAVICGSVSTNQYYPDFVEAVKKGSSADFYENGHGMDVLPISQDAYNDLINGVTHFYKVTNTDDVKYPLY